MAAYDQPGFSETVPGIGGSYSTWQTAPGSAGVLGSVADADAIGDSRGTTASSAWVTPNGGSVVNGDRVDVGPLDTLVPAQVDQYGGQDANPVSGVTGVQAGYTGAGQGTAGRFPHPNNGAGLGSGT